MVLNFVQLQGKHFPNTIRRGGKIRTKKPNLVPENLTQLKKIGFKRRVNPSIRSLKPLRTTEKDIILHNE